MEARMQQIEKEHLTMLKKIEDIEKSQEGNTFIIRDMAHKVTIIHGIATTRLDEIKERLERLDDRVTEAHKELAELRLSMATKGDINRIESEHGKLLQEHTMLLKQILEKLS